LERARKQVSDNTELALRKRKTLAQLGKLLEKQEIEFNSPIMQGIDQLLEEVEAYHAELGLFAAQEVVLVRKALEAFADAPQRPPSAAEGAAR